MKKFFALSFTLMLLFSLCLISSASDLDDIFVTKEMIERDHAVVEQMIEQGRRSVELAQMRRNTTKKMLEVPHLYQDDPDWANTYTPCNHFTFANAGCAATSYAMMSRYYATKGVNNTSRTETPYSFCVKYKTKNNTCICNQSADGAAKVWGRVATAASGLSQTNLTNFCVSAIDEGKPVIIRTDKWGSHYFVAYGYYIPSTGNATIYIRDPEGDYDATTLGTYYSSGASMRSAASI